MRTRLLDHHFQQISMESIWKQGHLAFQALVASLYQLFHFNSYFCKILYLISFKLIKNVIYKKSPIQTYKQTLLGFWLKIKSPIQINNFSEFEKCVVAGERAHFPCYLKKSPKNGSQVTDIFPQIYHRWIWTTQPLLFGTILIQESTLNCMLSIALKLQI